ncbi:MAG TPA: hypothetical protein VJ979_02555 [Actinomycetota bacterium]|nr:hypothetical protein [Actinomycetota bacterium]
MRRLLAGLTAVALLSAGALVVIGNSDPIPAGAAVAKEHRFSVVCEPVHRSAEDPFLDPIGTDQDHEHQFFGSVGIRTWPNGENRSDGMRGVATSCEHSGDTASYWVPMFMEADGDVVAPTQVLVYYRHSGSGPVVPHAPDTLLKSFDAEWGCVDSDHSEVPVNCSDRDLRMRVIFKPTQEAGVPTPRIAMNVRFDTRQGAGGHLMGGASGEHGNFFNTWDQDTYQETIDTCLVASSVAELTEAEWNALCPRTSGGEAP